MMKKLLVISVFLVLLFPEGRSYGEEFYEPGFNYEQEQEKDHDHDHDLGIYDLAVGQGSDEEDEEKIDDLKSKIKSYEKKIKDLQSKERTLENEIGALDGQIDLIQLRINEAVRNITAKEQELEDLIEEIGVLSGKIVVLQNKVSYQSLIFNERIRSRYKSGIMTPVEFIFGANLNNLVQKVTFIKAVEDEDKRLISELNGTRKNYEWQKASLEEKKLRVEEIKRKIESDKAKLVEYEASLDKEKDQKNAFLNQTKGDEAVYQQLLRKAKAELEAIEGAVASVNFANGKEVDEGEVIAVMGNSGYPNCSTGAHLHFEVRKKGTVVNAESYLKPKSVYASDFSSGTKTIGSGDWEWPMKSPEITQRYGKTPWSWRYSGGKHTGIDMVSSNTLIYAPEDGKVVRGTIGCYGSSMNYVAIDHGDSIVSYYFHVK